MPVKDPPVGKQTDGNVACGIAQLVAGSSCASAARPKDRFGFMRQDAHERDRRRLHHYPVLLSVLQCRDRKAQRIGEQLLGQG